MKKTKELLLFLMFLLMPPILCVIVTGVFSCVAGSAHFIALENYIRMFSNDKIFVKALVNTIILPTLVSIFAVAVFALFAFFARKKIKVPRWLFYLGSVFIGGVTALIYTVCASVSAIRVLSHSITALQSYVVAYQPSVFDAITFLNVFLSVYIGIFTAFIFLLLELILDAIKMLKDKGALNE